MLNFIIGLVIGFVIAWFIFKGPRRPGTGSKDYDNVSDQIRGIRKR